MHLKLLRFYLLTGDIYYVKHSVEHYSPKFPLKQSVYLSKVVSHKLYRHRKYEEKARRKKIQYNFNKRAKNHFNWSVRVIRFGNFFTHFLQESRSYI